MRVLRYYRAISLAEMRNQSAMGKQAAMPPAAKARARTPNPSKLPIIEPVPTAPRGKANALRTKAVDASSGDTPSRVWH